MHIARHGLASGIVLITLLLFVHGARGAGNYLVIDLSGGPTAGSSQVSYLEKPPSGGWTDEHKTTKLVLRRIPAGSFTMGSRATDCPDADEGPLSQVTLTRDFYIGVFEVTQKQWERVMGDYPSYFTNMACRDTRPVEQVSYFDIRENPLNRHDRTVDWPGNRTVGDRSFLGRLRAKTDLATLDLPTECQWEYACRAGTTTALNSGVNLASKSVDDAAAEVARYYYNGTFLHGSDQNVGWEGGTAKVGSYRPNSWGLYDLHGNVWEWCLDWYAREPGSGIDPVGAVSGAHRVLRGGSWGGIAAYNRSSVRFYGLPQARISGRGFRVAAALP